MLFRCRPIFSVLLCGAYMKSILPILTQMCEAGEPAALALLVRAQHSAPRPVGSALCLSASGRRAGAVSMGCVEADVVEHLQQVLEGGAPRLVSYGPSDAIGLEVGLSCGGTIELPVFRLDWSDAVWAELVRPEVRGVLRVDLSADHLGALSWSTSVEAVSDRALFQYRFSPDQRLLVLGMNPISEALCRGASRLAFDLWLIDPRPTLLRAAALPGTRAVCAWPAEGLERLAIGPESYVAVLTHDPKLDLPALETALKHKCRYIGLLGGSRTREQRKAALLEKGFSVEEVARLRTPIGLDIGAVSSEEIAVAILAEMIAVRPGRGLP